MPRIKSLIKPRSKPVKRDEVAELIRRHKRVKKITWEQIAPSFHVTPGTLAVRLSKGTGRYTVAELGKYCEVLEIPPEEMGEALAANIKEEQKWAH